MTYGSRVLTSTICEAPLTDTSVTALTASIEKQSEVRFTASTQKHAAVKTSGICSSSPSKHQADTPLKDSITHKRSRRVTSSFIRHLVVKLLLPSGRTISAGVINTDLLNSSEHGGSVEHTDIDTFKLKKVANVGESSVPWFMR